MCYWESTASLQALWPGGYGAPWKQSSVIAGHSTGWRELKRGLRNERNRSGSESGGGYSQTDKSPLRERVLQRAARSPRFQTGDSEWAPILGLRWVGERGRKPLRTVGANVKLRARGVENPRKFAFGSAAARESTLCVWHSQVGQNGAGNNHSLRHFKVAANTMLMLI